MRNIEFANGEYYHIYNRGVDKRTIFEDTDDFRRFFEGMQDFNAEETIGSLYEYRFIKNKKLGSSASKLRKPLVKFVAYCLNPNHYHFLLEQVSDDGISKFMHRLSTGYTKYFNKRHSRTGSLFSGRFKAIHVDSNEYLLWLSAYVNLNDHVHHLEGRSHSSMREYENEAKKLGKFCATEVVAGQFKSPKEYSRFAQEALKEILSNKEKQKELSALLSEPLGS